MQGALAQYFVRENVELCQVTVVAAELAALAAREAVPFAPGDLNRCLARMEAENRIMVDRIQQEVYLI